MRQKSGLFYELKIKVKVGEVYFKFDLFWITKVRAFFSKMDLKIIFDISVMEKLGQKLVLETQCLLFLVMKI